MKNNNDDCSLIQVPEDGKLGWIGIRKEDKSKWERRTPLTPDNVKDILQAHPHLKFFVQPSTFRVFRDIEYQKAGAVLTNDLSECSLILGVKEIPAKNLIPNRTFMFFSHVIKAQEHNMPSLDQILEKKIRLVDYEKITDEKGNRLVAFGKFAGNAGAIDFLAGLGKYFLNRGYSTPFLNVSYSYNYLNLAKAKETLTMVKSIIENEAIPEEFCPLVFAVTSKGKCATGVVEILECLAIKYVSPDELPELHKNPKDPAHKSIIYVTFIETEHMVKPIEPHKPFKKEDYYQNPDHYTPIFHEKYLPYISVLFHCMFWDEKYQKLISTEQMRKLAQEKRSRLLGICDITCDLEGSIEFLKKFTNIDNPFFLYNPITEEVSFDTTKPTTDILYHAVDYLPTELAWDASTHFGKQLTPLIENLAMSDIRKPLAEQGLVPELNGAVITWNGELTEKFSYIFKLRKLKEEMRNKHAFNSKPKLTKDTSFISFRLEGHLFDTMAINKLFDELDKLNVEFRVLDLEIGKRSGRKTFAYIQLFSKDRKSFGEAIDKVHEIAQQYDISILD